MNEFVFFSFIFAIGKNSEIFYNVVQESPRAGLGISVKTKNHVFWTAISLKKPCFGLLLI